MYAASIFLLFKFIHKIKLFYENCVIFFLCTILLFVIIYHLVRILQKYIWFPFNGLVPYTHKTTNYIYSDNHTYKQFTRK